jgi:peptidoglycan/LPS O-acetylase OafA/YrhL
MESSTNRKNQHKRIVGLDILRSMAILFVLYNHSLIILRGNGFLFLKPISFDGVNLFFVLSGFLIGKIIYDAFNENFSFNSLINFWLFRAFKIIPSYLIILFILLILSKLTQLSTESFSMKYFIFSQNLSSFHPDFFKEAWSLSVEEWFYFAFPLFFYLLYLVTKKLKVSALICVFFFILFSLAARIFYFENNELIVQ